ncbi:hypothetical protein [Jannaschia sp. M317]|uniref:hypothetical protein n=1 Tax=Jannaschia sp. M317 TaxID=2867011 RepID=UPI0021A8878E|nr:hypothetical protein [Jannaschia sp. M317]UWQ17269.1 hypothetical protein K3551_15480 [Jannaschia sp. M317]
MSRRARLRVRLRPVVMAAHWAVPIVIVGTLARPSPGWTGALALCTLILLLALAAGGLTRPGPSLTGALRPLHRYGHIALLTLLTAATLAYLTGLPFARPLLLVTFMLGLLHGIFHLWRHTVLGDGALRNILPRAVHSVL